MISTSKTPQLDVTVIRREYPGKFCCSLSIWIHCIGSQLGCNSQSTNILNPNFHNHAPSQLPFYFPLSFFYIYPLAIYLVLLHLLLSLATQSAKIQLQAMGILPLLTSDFHKLPTTPTHFPLSSYHQQLTYLLTAAEEGFVLSQ